MVPLDELVMSNSLKRVYGQKNRVVHYVVNQKIRQRLPGFEYECGDRVPYIVLRGGSSGCTVGDSSVAERAEHSSFVLSNPTLIENIDWCYYLLRFKSSMQQIFLSLKLPDKNSPHKIITRMFQHAQNTITRTFSNIKAIAQYSDITPKPAAASNIIVHKFPAGSVKLPDSRFTPRVSEFTTKPTFNVSFLPDRAFSLQIYNTTPPAKVTSITQIPAISVGHVPKRPRYIASSLMQCSKIK